MYLHTYIHRYKNASHITTERNKSKLILNPQHTGILK